MGELDRDYFLNMSQLKCRSPLLPGARRAGGIGNEIWEEEARHRGFCFIPCCPACLNPSGATTALTASELGMFTGLSKELHVCLYLAVSAKAPSALIKQTQNSLSHW